MDRGRLSFYNGGLCVTDEAGKTRLEFDAANYASTLVEQTLEWSYMKPVRLFEGGKTTLPIRAAGALNVAEEIGTPLAAADCALSGVREWTRPVTAL